MLFGCGNDDSGSGKLIIGKWQQASKFNGYEEDFLNDCEKNSTFEFFRDNTFKSVHYNSDCDDFIVNGTWENTSGSNYELDSGEVVGEYIITFPDHDNMSIKLENVIPEAPGYVIVNYVRIE